jgi:hypothetical protein
MSGQRSITFAVATYRTDEILRNNFLASPCLQGAHDHQILIQRDYLSAAKACNEAIDRAENDLMVFAHQDMIFPESWPAQLERALAYLEKTDPAWGVLGCCGVAHDGTYHVWVYHPTQGLLGRPFDRPVPIQTLDEIVLIFRRSSGLRFDECLPHFHLYGTDICLRATKMGMKCYAISAFCVHNGTYFPLLPKEFYENYRYIRKIWKDYLPIHTSCQNITRMEFPMYKRRVQEAYLQYIQRRAILTPRAKDGAELLQQVTSELQGC